MVTAMVTPPDTALAPGWQRMLIVCSILSLLWVLSVRILGPSDAWDQDQPKTMSYTTDILVNGNWTLPVERGVIKASKPPMYNWIAAPFVWILGFSSEVAHKTPSLLAFGICWLIVVRIGRAIGGPENESLGWLAGVIVAANYTMFKLSYVARPDMVLTMWLTLGWAAATALLVSADSGSTRRRSVLRMAFWLCVGCAALTKGPPAVLLLIYALVGGRLLGGSWRRTRIFQWSWGLPLALALPALWVLSVYSIDAEHLRERLWFQEIYGRVTGLGEQGNTEGPIEFFRRLGHVPAYYFARFAPWSVLALLAIVGLLTRVPAPRGFFRAIIVFVLDLVLWVIAEIRRLLSREQVLRERPPFACKTLGQRGLWLLGACVMTTIMFVLFTLSTGKRADYIAAGYPIGALLASWWLLDQRPFVMRRLPWLAPATAAIVLGGMTWYVLTEVAAHERGFGSVITDFIAEAHEHISVEPRPLAFWNEGGTQIQAYLGSSHPTGSKAVREMLGDTESIWLIAGRRKNAPFDAPAWADRLGLDVSMTPVVQSTRTDRYPNWPEQITLYRVDPRP